MKKIITLAAALALSTPAFAQDEPGGAPSPNQIVDAAPAAEWRQIAAEDLLVMTLAPDGGGNAREVVIQLMPAPFSQGWVSNIRTLARAGWYDGISVNRVQDNYVVQWGDANVDNPEATGAAKVLPEGLRVMSEWQYNTSKPPTALIEIPSEYVVAREDQRGDGYAAWTDHRKGWPFAENRFQRWPVHCYGMVGVGRSYSPDTGTGAELYTVIGHAPRHLDRNIALVGRVIEGIEHLSSLPRGTGALGFYESAEERVPIQSIRVVSDLEAAEASSSEAVGQTKPPTFEYLSTESATFARYADARANRRDPFFIVPAGGADICNIPVPVRRVAERE